MIAITPYKTALCNLFYVFLFVYSYFYKKLYLHCDKFGIADQAIKKPYARKYIELFLL